MADLATGTLFGHFVSLSGPPDTPVYSWRRLFGAARRLGRIREIVRLQIALSIDRFEAHKGQGLLFLPLDDSAGDEGDSYPHLLEGCLAAGSLHPERLVIVAGVTGDHGKADAGRAFKALEGIRRLGCRLASVGFECSDLAMRIWSQAGADYVVIERDAMEGIDPAVLRGSYVARSIASADSEGRKVVAFGVESIGTLKVLRDLKVAAAAGDFIGNPALVPSRTLSAGAQRLMEELIPDAASVGGRNVHILTKLLREVRPVTPDTHADTVFGLFERTPDLQAVAIVKDGVPTGLITRYEMVDNMARPYRHELYGRKPCIRFMDRSPLMVDIHIPLAELADVLVRTPPSHLIGGFIITDAGRYLGIGSVQDLVREVAAMQMEAARYANPLTLLPGNVPIGTYIDSLLAAMEPCAIAYCDLDNFKPFNDAHGYARGDDVIRLTARILGAVCVPDRDFIGHIGGDDFVLVFRSDDWEARCARALSAFGEEILGFFSQQDVERGGYEAENRKGDLEFHPLTSLSIGVTTAPPGAFMSHLDVASVAAEVKKKAKGVPGNSLYINRRTY